jgi:hypothetical protein
VARLCVALVSPGRTEIRSKREDIKGVRPEDDALGGSCWRSVVRVVGQQADGENGHASKANRK